MQWRLWHSPDAEGRAGATDHILPFRDNACRCTAQHRYNLGEDLIDQIEVGEEGGKERSSAPPASTASLRLSFL
jgi:hypothetical protein